MEKEGERKRAMEGMEGARYQNKFFLVKCGFEE